MGGHVLEQTASLVVHQFRADRFDVLDARGILYQGSRHDRQGMAAQFGAGNGVGRQAHRPAGVERTEKQYDGKRRFRHDKGNRWGRVLVGTALGLVILVPFYRKPLHVRRASLLKRATRIMRTWMCLICGWIYDEEAGLPEEGIAPGTRWEDVPPNWVCPECGARKEDFELIEV